MEVWLTITLVVGLALGGVPHAFCACECAVPSQPAAGRAGQGCCGGQTDPAPEQPDPCQCRTCNVVKVVAADSQTSVPSLDLTSRVPLTAVGLSVRLAPADKPEDVDPAEPPGRLARLGCALPVLWGHLLL